MRPKHGAIEDFRGEAGSLVLAATNAAAAMVDGAVVAWKVPEADLECSKPELGLFISVWECSSSSCSIICEEPIVISLIEDKWALLFSLPSRTFFFGGGRVLIRTSIKAIVQKYGDVCDRENISK